MGATCCSKERKSRMLETTAAFLVTFVLWLWTFSNNCHPMNVIAVHVLFGSRLDTVTFLYLYRFCLNWPWAHTIVIQNIASDSPESK